MLWILLLLMCISVSGKKISCDSYSTVKLNFPLPPIRIIFNSNDTQMRDIFCLFQSLGNIRQTFETGSQPCIQLFTVSFFFSVLTKT